jgi:hypothetical protein
MLDGLTDQKPLAEVVCSCKLDPLVLTDRTMVESGNGVSRFATHTTVRGVICVYQMPKYQRLELPVVKKPSVNALPEETNSSGYARGESMVMISLDRVTEKTEKKVNRRGGSRWASSHLFMATKYKFKRMQTNMCLYSLQGSHLLICLYSPPNLCDLIS